MASARCTAVRAAHASATQNVVSDLLSLVSEGSSWDFALESSKGKHSRIWRLIFGVFGSREPPSFSWTPAHKSLEDALSFGIPLRWRAGSMWANWLAKLGASAHAVSSGHAECFSSELQRAKAILKYVS